MSEHDHVSCKQALDLLFAYLEGELDASTVAAVRQHFGVCPPCEQFLQSYKQTPGLCREALDKDVPPEVMGGLKAFLRSKLPKG